jgi:hypothetical protein
VRALQCLFPPPHRLAPAKQKDPSHPGAHTYRLQIVKERCPPPFGGRFRRCRSAMSKDRDYTSKTGPVNTPSTVRTRLGVRPRPRPQRPDRAAGQASAR